MRRDIRALADFFRQQAVAFGALDQSRESAFRQPCMLVVGDIVYDLAIAPLDQDVGDGFADRRAARDGKKVCLTLGRGDLDEVGLVEPR